MQVDYSVYKKTISKLRAEGKLLKYRLRLLELRHNPYHDPKNGQFCSGNELTGSGGSDIIKSDAQFGKKIGKHASDWGLNPALKEDRDKMEAIIDDIYYNRNQPIRIGSWRGQTEEVLFHIKDSDVVITKKSGEFITILKGGINSGRVKNAREY